VTYRFIATDMKLDDLDGSVWPTVAADPRRRLWPPTLAGMQRIARRMYTGGQAQKRT
jgi:hypothetical protein